MAYVERDRPIACIFCLDAAGTGRDLVLFEDDVAVVLLNRYPYNPGHLLIAPRRHVARFGALEAIEYAGLMDRLRTCLAILEDELTPQGINVGVNLGATAGAGIADHLHWHAVPRWDGDTNFMPVVADVKVIPQHLDATAARLRARFVSPSGRQA
jgi:ATP adenylyltransferase